MSDSKLQTADQTLKGAIIGLGAYIANKYDVDPQLIALAIPVAAGIMAHLSTLFGNPNTACIFVDKNKE